LKFHGSLMTSFQMLGSIHFSISLKGYPDVGETNRLLEHLKDRSVEVTIEEALP
jgi:hypothetical protein